MPQSWLTLSFLKEFAKRFLPSAGAIVVFSLWFIVGQEADHRERVRVQEWSLVEREKEVLQARLMAYISDTLFLADAVTMITGDEDCTPDSQDGIADLFARFARARHLYDQVRLISASGQELVRVQADEEGVIQIARGSLRDKSERVYFQNARELPPGAVYVSAMDLNVEDGQVEVPHKPVLRVATPIYTDDGAGGDELFGVVVVNFLGENLLARLRRANTTSQGRLYLAAQSGHWIIGPDRKVEWGMSLSSRSGHGLHALWPETWERIRHAEAGQLVRPHGLFTFDCADVAHAKRTPGLEHLPIFAETDLFLVSVVNSRELGLAWKDQAMTLMALGVAASAGLTLLWANAAHRRRQDIQMRRRSEQKFAAMSRASYDALVIIDATGRINFWNQAAEAMFGHAPKEVLGRSLHDTITPGEQYDRTEASVKGVSLNKEGPHLHSIMELMARRQDGSDFPVERSMATFDVDGEWFAVAILRDITERKQAEEKLRRLATTDSLTGIANRHRFLEVAARELSRSKRYGHSLSLLMIDADHFKKVNDTYGHDVGDEVLVAIADLGRRALRDTDLLGRLGGEEFAVLLPETGLDAATEVAERLRQGVAAAPVSTAKGPVPITVSIGVTTYGPGVDTPEALIKLSDVALYEAKSAGRNVVRVRTEPESAEESLRGQHDHQDQPHTDAPPETPGVP